MTHPQHRRSISLGIAAASALPVLGILCYAKVWPKSSDLWQAVLFICALSFTGILVLGLPVVLFLRHRGWLTWLTVLGSSVVVGNLYYQVLALFYANGPEPSQLIGGTALGLLAGVGFCIGAWPNKSFKPNPLRGSA
jgi:hypothetical protein